MSRIELGFLGQRVIYVPITIVDIMQNSPLTSDLYVYSMGFFAKASYHYIDRDSGCDEYVFIYCKEGIGYVELYNKRYVVKANQFIILPPNIPHKYEADIDDPWSIYWIHFKGNNAHKFGLPFNEPTQIPLHSISRIEERLDLFEEIYFTLNNQLTMDSLHYACLCFSYFMGSFLYMDIYKNNLQRKEYSHNVINRVIHFMNDNIENNPSIRELSEFCGYSDSHFYRKFVSVTGHSPMEYFMRMKIDKACKLLMNTDMKITQISQKLGFRESQYFSRTFSSIMKISPSGFRKQNFTLGKVNEL